jgi:hypothetical protein
MEHHQSCLKNLCRICAQKIKSYKHDKTLDGCCSLLLLAFGIEVVGESEDVYPPFVCHQCFRTLQKIKKSKETRVAFKTTLSPSEWIPHSDSEDQTQTCTVCNNLYFRHKKTKSQGRPCNEDITHISRNFMREVNDINPPQFSDIPLQISFFLPTPALEDLSCRHCNCIPNQPLEIQPCYHLFCATCIKRITETRNPTCCNPDAITPADLSIPHPLVIKQLRSLLLSCPLLCGQVIQLEHLSKHLESNCRDADIPPLSAISVHHVLEAPLGSALEHHVMGKLASKFIPPTGSVTYKLPNGKV